MVPYKFHRPQKIGVVGSGKMGLAIATLLWTRDWDVVVLGRDPAAMERQNRRFQKRLDRVGAAPGEADHLPALAPPRFTTAWDVLGDCALVLETVTEHLDTKIEMLQRAEAVASPRAILASNTSSLSITRLAAGLRDPRRFGGLHFFHPIPLTSIVEIVTAPSTSPGVVEYLRDVAGSLARTPLVVKDLPGSCINAVLTGHTGEALYVLEQGLALPSQLDRIAARFARVGPCEMIDAIGIPLFRDVLGGVREAYDAAPPIPELCDRLIRDGRLGRYAGRGLYLYPGGVPADDAPAYYVNPAQRHSRPGARAGEAGLYERLLFSIYFSLLRIAATGRAELADLCLGVRDAIGLHADPLEQMRALGPTGLREVFGRLLDEVGPRYDGRPLAGILASLQDDGACVTLRGLPRLPPPGQRP